MGCQKDHPLVLEKSDVLGKCVFIKEEYSKYLNPDRQEFISKGQQHDRPCLCILYDKRYDLCWMVPISSRVANVAKYQCILSDKIAARGRCDTIVIAWMNHGDKAFLIQNLFPVPISMIKNVYVKNDGSYMRPAEEVIRDISDKSIRVLNLEMRGYHIIMDEPWKVMSRILEERRRNENARTAEETFER